MPVPHLFPTISRTKSTEMWVLSRKAEAVPRKMAQIMMYLDRSELQIVGLEKTPRAMAS